MSQVSDSGLMLCLPLRCLLESALLCPPCLLCLSHSTDWSLVPGKWQHRWAVQLGSGPNADVLIKNRMNFQEKSRKCLALNLSAGVNPVSHRQDEQWCSYSSGTLPRGLQSSFPRSCSSSIFRIWGPHRDFMYQVHYIFPELLHAACRCHCCDCPASWQRLSSSVWEAWKRTTGITNLIAVFASYMARHHTHAPFCSHPYCRRVSMLPGIVLAHNRACQHTFWHSGRGAMCPWVTELLGRRCGWDHLLCKRSGSLRT